VSSEALVEQLLARVRTLDPIVAHHQQMTSPHAATVVRTPHHPRAVIGMSARLAA